MAYESRQPESGALLQGDRRHFTAIIVSVALAVCACSTGVDDPDASAPTPGEFTVTQTSPTVVVATPDGSGGGDAQVIGQLEYLAEPDCFVLDGFGDDRSRVALAWPPGTTASLAGQIAVVAVLNFGEVRSGDWLLGAGYYNDPHRGLPSLPAACSPSDTEFAVLYDVTEAGPEPLIDE